MMVINLAKTQTKSAVLTVKNSCLPNRLSNVTFSGEKEIERRLWGYFWFSDLYKCATSLNREKFELGFYVLQQI
jgi:hypothetical protein